MGIVGEVGVKAFYPVNQTEGIGRRKDPFGDRGLECEGMWDYLSEFGDHRKQFQHVGWKSGGVEGDAGGGNVEILRR